MLFHGCGLPGVFRVSPEPKEDDRGLFARTFCAQEFRQRELTSSFVQSNVSWNTRRGTLRGMHFQRPPHEEVKLVRCTRGAAYDVVLDLRKDSPAYLQWSAFEITADNRAAIYIPAGCAHGFQTLADGTELFYQMSAEYAPGLAAGVRWNDPAFLIEWPIANPTLSERDATYPDFAK